MFQGHFNANEQWRTAPGPSSTFIMPMLPTTTSATALLQFDACVGVTESGSGVSSWVDQINSVDVIQATEANKPLLVGASMNGLPVIRFDGTNDQLTALGYTTAASFNGNTGFSAFCVAKTSNAPTSIDYMWAVNSGGFTGHGVRTGPDRIDMLNYSDTGVGFVLLSSFNYHDGNAVIFHSRGLMSDSPELEGSARKSGQTVTGTGTLAGSTFFQSEGGSDPQFYMGGNVSGQHYNGDIAEVIIYDNKIDDTDRDAVLDYLNSKWGVGATV